MNEKIILITGSTDGIGKQAAFELAESGACVVIHGRDKKRVQFTVDEIKKIASEENVLSVTADLSSLKSVRKMVEDLKTICSKIDVLINNAGVFMNTKKLTEDGYETTFAVNHLSHFLLTNLLLNENMISSKGRIITVSSIAHHNASYDPSNLQGEKSFSGYSAYALSKLANILFAYELSEKLKSTEITSNALHPGVISTKLLKEGFNSTGASLIQGAATLVYLASSEEVEGISGKYFVNNKISESSRISYDKKIMSRFWEISLKLAGLS
jgi:NAD(P)-dependent dehydrogenase (short-subunit alcohol dehydrogenase family)